MNLLDRYILKQLIYNYLIALAVMIALYVVLDLFFNLDEFTEQAPTASAMLWNVAGYYLPNVFLYFSQLSGVITLFACAMTIVRMRRFRELTALLSSGVSLHRVAAPVICFAVFTNLFLLPLDTEVAIPRMAHHLARRHDEVGTKKAYAVTLMRDREGRLVSAGQFIPHTGVLHGLVAMTLDEAGGLQGVLEADKAEWEPIPGHRYSGRWRLWRGESTTQEASGSSIGPQTRERIAYPPYFETNLDPATIQIRQSEQWIRFLSLEQLSQLSAEAPPAPNLPDLLQTFHARIAGFGVNLILLCLGLPFFLARTPEFLVRDATRALLLCGLLYAVAFASRSITPETGSPMPAWLPIVLFGPIAGVLFDRIRT